MSGEFWLNQSVHSFFDHRRAEQLLRCSLDEMGITPRELHALARRETLDHFRDNPFGWTEEQICELVDSVSEPDPEIGDLPQWDRVVVVEISEQ